MQRAAAVNPDTSELTAAPSPSKRRKISASASTSRVHNQAIRDEIASEESRQAEALERQAERAGETKWAFSFLNEQEDATNMPKEDMHGDFQIVHAGYANIDEATSRYGYGHERGDEARRKHVVGRMRFGSFKNGSKVRHPLENGPLGYDRPRMSPGQD